VLDFQQLLSNESFITLLFVVLFYCIVYLFKLIKQDSLEKMGISINNLLIMYKTEKLNDFIENVGSKYSRFWKIFFTVGIIVSIYLSLVGIYYFHTNLIDYLFKKEGGSPVQLIVPGLTIGLESLPYLAIAFFVTLIPHEFFHGFAASSENIRIKSSGLFYFILFFGGFIEPDEEELEKSRLLPKIRVFSAGSYANFLTFILISVILTMVITPIGVYIRDVHEDYPAYGKLLKGDIIIGLNGTRVKNFEELDKFMSKTKPNETLIVKIIRNGNELEVSLKLAENPYNKSRGIMGVLLSDYYENMFLFRTLYWIWIITQSVAIINMMPIMFLDGGQIILAIFKKILKDDKAEKAYFLISAYLFIVLVINIILSFEKWGIKAIWAP